MENKFILIFNYQTEFLKIDFSWLCRPPRLKLKNSVMFSSDRHLKRSLFEGPREFNDCHVSFQRLFCFQHLTYYCNAFCNERCYMKLNFILLFQGQCWNQTPLITSDISPVLFSQWNHHQPSNPKFPFSENS